MSELRGGAALHVDANNEGDSLILALGDFDGGELWVEGRGALDVRRRWQRFDGTRAHATLPWWRRRGDDPRVATTPARHDSILRSHVARVVVRIRACSSCLAFLRRVCRARVVWISPVNDSIRSPRHNFKRRPDLTCEPIRSPSSTETARRHRRSRRGAILYYLLDAPRTREARPGRARARRNARVRLPADGRVPRRRRRGAPPAERRGDARVPRALRAPPARRPPRLGRRRHRARPRRQGTVERRARV